MRFGVRSFGLWTPSYRGLPAWSSGPPEASATEPDDALLGGQRRRSTLLTRMVADVVRQCGGAPALVLGSAGGELEQTFATLPLMFETPPASSPLRFGNSVHNAALGHLSIATGSRAFASAISARPDRLAATVLVEAVALAAEGEPVLAMWAEERWPGSEWPPLAVAITILPQGAWTLAREDRLPPTVDDRLRGHPLAEAVALATALSAGHALGLAGGWAVSP